MIQPTFMPKCQKLPLMESILEYQEKETEPERRLLNALLIRAMQDATGNISCPYGIREDVQDGAISWIMDESEDPWSFEWVCSHVSVSVSLIRLEISNALNKGEKLYLVGGRQPGFYKRA